MAEIVPKEIVQIGDTYLVRFNCPNCAQEQFEGYPIKSCSACKFDLSPLPLNTEGRYRLVSGSRRNKKHVSKRVVQSLIQMYGLQCSYCFKPIQNEMYHVDHIVPLCVGGSNNLDNLTLSCPRCNLLAGSMAFPSLVAKRAYINSKY